MKTILKTALFGLALTTCLTGYSHTSSADDNTEQTAPKTHRHRGGFRLGVCVGRTLGGTPGEKPDPTAFQAAVESCKAKFKDQASTSSH